MTFSTRSKLWAGLAGAVMLIGALCAFELTATRPASSQLYQQWLRSAGPQADRGAALLAFGNFGALDLDTLETAALPWPFVATALALHAADGHPERVEMAAVQAALKQFGFLFPKSILGHPDLKPSEVAPLGLSIGVIERSLPPLRVTAMTLGCAACHAGPAYRQDGTPDTDIAVLGRPNSGINLEAFSAEGYAAIKQALKNEPAFLGAMHRLFPDMTVRERLTLRWIALPKLRQRIAELASGMDRPLPFRNGAPGLTNGVAALKMELGLASRHTFVDGAGFVSIPDLADRNFRSALLADGAYAPKGEGRFRPITQTEARARRPEPLAAIASFFMVPSMGLASERAEAAIPELTAVMAYLARLQAPSFPGLIDAARAARGKDVYARACATCHGTYNESLTAPKLVLFPNWAGSVGTDMSRAQAFTPQLKAAVDRTNHGKRHLDVAATGMIAAPLLSGVWASAPYFVNGSVPTLRHVLEPETRPARFTTGGHRLDLERVGVAGAPAADGSRASPIEVVPYAKPALIDTTKPGSSNRGHEAEVRGLTPDDRTNLIEYLKLL
ncbi:MAG: c-type cytochrome [Hyphomicrobiaceae bacterium]